MNNRDKDIIINIAKSMHKCIYKALQYKGGKPEPKEVVADILDGNYRKEADENAIPPRKVGVVYKSEDVVKKLTEVIIDRYNKIKDGSK
jgi:hypothetical protein